MRKKLPLLFGAAFFALALGACEGPEGPAGATGPQGEQGPVGPPGQDGENALNTCADCHHSDATIVAVEFQFAQSPHGDGFEYRGPDYAGGSCVNCHTHQGYVAAAAGEEPDFTFGGSPITCYTCHQIHDSFTGDDFALTAVGPVTLRLTDNTVDFTATSDEGVTLEGNLCASCHQGRIRDPWPSGSADPSATFDITSSHFGPHYSTQANVLAGELGQVEIPGTFNIPSNQMHDPHGVERSCTGCHMNYDPTDEDIALGGHAFEVEVGTCQTCHATAVDFDYHGVQTDVEETLDEILACLEVEGVVEVNAETGEAHPIGSSSAPNTVPETYAAAWVIWEAFHADGSLGVHNPGYAQTVLGNTIEHLRDTSTACAALAVAP